MGNRKGSAGGPVTCMVAAILLGSLGLSGVLIIMTIILYTSSGPTRVRRLCAKLTGAQPLNRLGEISLKDYCGSRCSGGTNLREVESNECILLALGLQRSSPQKTRFDGSAYVSAVEQDAAFHFLETRHASHLIPRDAQFRHSWRAPLLLSDKPNRELRASAGGISIKKSLRPASSTIRWSPLRVDCTAPLCLPTLGNRD